LDTLYEKIKRRHELLRKKRQPYEALWTQVIDMMRPELSAWGADDESSKAAKRGIDIYNSYPEYALGNWADGMQGNLCSASIDWFKYEMALLQMNDLPEVRQWLMNCHEGIRSLLQDSNYYSTIGGNFRDAGSTGDTVMFMEADPIERQLDFSNFHPREVYHDKGIFHHEFKMTAMTAAEKFGKDKLSQSVNNNLEKNGFAMHKFIHACYRKDDPILEGQSVPDREYISIYIEHETDKMVPLDITGYRSKPWVHWAYYLPSDSEYGWGPGSSAIVEVYGLNEATRVNMTGQQKLVEPPVKAHRNLRGRLNLNPNGYTWVDRPEETIEPIPIVPDMRFGLEREDRLAQAIKERFSVDFFHMLKMSERQMTATEIMERAGEKSVLMAPKTGRLERYFLNPAQDWVFSVAMELGFIPEPPDVVLYESDGRINVNYMGPLAQAQKRMFETRRTERVMAELNMYATLFPQSLHYMKSDKSIQRTLRDNEWPEEEIATDEEVQAIREQIAQQQQAMMQAEMAKEAADAVPKLAKAPETGSPLEALSQ